jgi:2-keto-3-deoxy-6-phosphogluconate aldolase
MKPLTTTGRKPGEIYASYSFISAARNPVPELRFGITGGIL